MLDWRPTEEEVYITQRAEAAPEPESKVGKAMALVGLVFVALALQESNPGMAAVCVAGVIALVVTW